MSGAVRVCRRSLLIACAAGLAIVGTWSTAALAGTSYTVGVTVVPNQVRLHSVFHVTASGYSANVSRLQVFLNQTVPCQPTESGDAAFASDRLVIHTTVVNLYTKTTAGLGAKHAGNHFACAYLSSIPLTPPALLRAQASAPYTIG
jgi:hypothetical protein